MENNLPPPQNDPVITVDGKNYKFSELPLEIQRLVVVFNNWQLEGEKLNADMKKLEYAINGISAQIGAEIRKMNEPTPQVSINP